MRNSLKILLVEDDATTALIHKTYLLNLGCHVICANSGEEAIEKFNYRIDAVLMDIELPGQNGYEVTRAIRTYYETQIPIFACTSCEKDIMLKCLMSGMSGYLPKPCDRAMIEKFLKIVLDNPLASDCHYQPYPTAFQCQHAIV